VIDAYDAMINDRVYRKAITQEEAILEIERNAGAHFDPEIIDVFIKTIMDIWS
jgi:HD-GYP domain-containing protein (c-di-GMP phosphodiesterase class II)